MDLNSKLTMWLHFVSQELGYEKKVQAQDSFKGI